MFCLFCVFLRAGAYSLYTQDANASLAKQMRKSGIPAFVFKFIKIAERILLSVVVQLIAQAARSGQSVRTARILSLASCSLFFMFLQRTARIP